MLLRERNPKRDHRFVDRHDAGAALAQRLGTYCGRSDVVVLGLPRGGIPVAYEVARAIGAPLDVFVVRKLGVPGYRELAMGAIASGGVQVLDGDLVASLNIPVAAVAAVVAEETRELRRREGEYRGRGSSTQLESRVVILVDDGLATGSTMRAAVQAVRRARPARIIVAVPVCSRDACAGLRNDADEVICLCTPEPFEAVGLWYRDFSDTTDEEVRRLLGEPVRAGSAPRSA